MRWFVRLAYHLIPHLMRAVVYVGIIMVAAPLRMLLDDRPRRKEPTNMNDSETVNETNDNNDAPAEATTEVLPDALLDPEVAQLAEHYNAAVDALDGANVPSMAPDGHPVSVGHPLTLAARVLLLVQERDWLKGSRDADYAELRDSRRRVMELEGALESSDTERKNLAAEANELRGQLARIRETLRQAGAPMDELMVDQGAVWVGRDLEAARRAASETEGRLSELHITLRQTFDADSVAEALEKAFTLRGADTKLAHFVSQRDAEAAGLVRERDDAVKDRDFFKEAAERASEEVRSANDTASMLAGVVADRDAQIEALQVEVSMLESHVDCIDDAVAGPDMWADWDLEVES